jgi:hypothetical protein
MRRILIAAALCALASFVLMSGSAQAAGTNGGGLPARSGATPAKTKKAPKGAKYEWCEQEEDGEFNCSYVPLELFNKTHTWNFVELPTYGGTFEKDKKLLVLYYTGEFDTGSILEREKVKKVYEGYFYYWTGEEFVIYPVLKELRKAPKA